VTAGYVAALDQGTTSTRCILFDHEGRMVSIAQRLHHQHHPRPGWVEHDPLELWRLTCRVMVEAFEAVDAGPGDVVALGVTNQRETTVLWDRRTGKPVHHAIGWQDTRTADLVTRIGEETDPDEVLRRSGLPLATYFSGSKLRWLFEHDPDLHAAAARGDLLFGTIDSWIVWNLTGGAGSADAVHTTDATNASRTQLMHLDTLDWDEDLLELMRVPRAVLPTIRPSMGAGPRTVQPIAGIPIAAVVGDQQASLFGQAAFSPGDAKCTFGTGSFLLLNTGASRVPASHGLISTVALTETDGTATYALEGSNAVAGGLVQWVVDNLGVISTPAEIETLASVVPDNGGCYLVPAFSGLFAPYWDPMAQGVLVGLTAYVTRHHIARAVLEATAFQTRDVVAAMNAASGLTTPKLTVDGGMTSDNLLMQMVADQLDIPVVRPMMAESVALGAAYAAGLAQGFWDDREELLKQWRVAAEWVPSVPAERREREYRGWCHAIEVSRVWGRLRPAGAAPPG